MSSDPDVFDDSEPEDAWDANDPIPELIDNLLQRCALLERSSIDVERPALLAEIEHRLLRAVLRRDLDDRDRLRIEQAQIDLAFIRDRIAEHLS